MSKLTVSFSLFVLGFSISFYYLFPFVRDFDSNNEITFRAYTDPRNPEEYNEIKIGDLKSLQTSGLKPGEKLTILTHIFMEDSILEKAGSFKLKDAHLKYGRTNLVLVHWKRVVDKPLTSLETFLMMSSVVLHDQPNVGRILADFIHFLVKEGNLVEIQNVHVIGFSVGGHLAGVAGKHLKEKYALKLGRITGLNPSAGVLKFASPAKKLKRGDADFVQVLHSDNFILGSPEAIGDLDFYSNGGIRAQQPNCDAGVIHPSFIDQRFCGHTGSVFIYAESMQKEITGCKCEESNEWFASSPCVKPKSGECEDPVVFGERATLGSGRYYISL